MTVAEVFSAFGVSVVASYGLALLLERSVHISRAIARRSARLLPERDRSDQCREWLALLDELHGSPASSLALSFGLTLAAFRIGSADALGNGWARLSWRWLSSSEHKYSRQLSRSGAVEKWAIRDAQDVGMAGSLGTFPHNSEVRTSGVYAPSAWQADRPLRLSDIEPVLQPLPSRVGSVEGRPTQIDRRSEQLKVDLWNGPALLVDALPTSARTPVQPYVASYFEIAPPMIDLEDEAIAGARRWRGTGGARRAERLLEVTGRGLGGTVVYVVEIVGQEPRVLIHKRSEEVGTNPGLWCTIPTYITEANGPGSGYGIVTWNVLREILEEVYDESHLNVTDGQPHVDSFLEYGFGKELDLLMNDGFLQLYHLGWSLNLVNGLLDAVTLVHAVGPEERVAPLVKATKVGAFEVDTRVDSLRWLDLYSDELSEACMRHSFHGASAVAIGQARRILQLV